MTAEELPRLSVLGLVPSVVYVPSLELMYPVPAGRFPGAVPLAIGLVWTAIVAFSEEITFRGYLHEKNGTGCTASQSYLSLRITSSREGERDGPATCQGVSMPFLS